MSEARDGQARDGIDDDGPDVLEPDAGSIDGASGDLLEQEQRMVQEDFGSRLPAMLDAVPLRRLAGVARFDPGIAEEAVMPGQLREEVLGPARRIILRQPVSWHGGRHACDLHIEACRRLAGASDLAGRLEHDGLHPSTIAQGPVVWGFAPSANQRLRRRIGSILRVRSRVISATKRKSQAQGLGTQGRAYADAAL
ncbi:MAG: hypothetical protein ACLQF1_11515 [Methyloceanibacter sp.]